MKNDMTTTLLNFVLAVLVILCVVFALGSIWRTRDLRQMQMQLQRQIQNNQAKGVVAQALLADVANYNATAKSPELTQLIQAAQAPAQPAQAAK